MAWNEPGKDKDKDPWGGRGGNDGPPNLDEVFSKIQKKLNGIFGNGSGRGGNASSGGTGIVAAVIAGVAVLLYGLAGFYSVNTKERAVVLQFGAFNEIKGE